MWPARIVALSCLLLALLIGGAALAQFNKCGRGFCPNGITGPGFPSGGGSITPPAGCDGTIDLSTGCTMPMLR